MVFVIFEIHTFLSVLAGGVVIALLFGSDGRYDYGEWPLWRIVLLSMMGYQVVFLTACFLLLPRRHGKKLVKALDSLPEFKTHRLKTRDGLELTWFKSEVPSGSDAPLMLVCLPNGQDGPAMFNPLFSLFGHRFQYVCWSYRGIFGSGIPAREARMSIRDHAEDGYEVLKASGFSKADVIIGHSQGVAVALEFVLLFPGAAEAVILLNGSHGQVLSTAFQPAFRIPLMRDFVCRLIDFGLRRPWVLKLYRDWVLQPWVNYCIPIYTRIFGSRLLMSSPLFGKDYLKSFFDSYLGGLTKSEENLVAWLRIFQALDAHSVWHYLHLVEHPTLIISGLWDVFTPAVCSFQMARRMPNARHFCDVLSSHATLLENPAVCLSEIDDFLNPLGTFPRFQRQSSSKFTKLAEPVVGKVEEDLKAEDKPIPIPKLPPTPRDRPTKRPT